MKSCRCLKAISVPLSKKCGIPVLNNVKEMLAILVAATDVRVRIGWEETCMGLPHGGRSEPLKWTEQRLQMFEPDPGDGARVGGPEKLELVAFEN